MRRIAVLLGLITVLVAMAAGVAVAVDWNVKQCRDIPCYGTGDRDLIRERIGSERDRIFGQGAGDRIDAQEFFNDRDVLTGGDGGDVLLSRDQDGADTLRGGRGSDRCIADQGDATRSCREVDPQSAEGQAILAGESP